MLQIEPLIDEASILLNAASVVRRRDHARQRPDELPEKTKVHFGTGSVQRSGRSSSSWGGDDVGPLHSGDTIMTKLTQAQRGVLSSASKHELGLATRPANFKPAQATRMAAFFTANMLAKEIKAKLGGPVWREDEQGCGLALKILKAGRAAFDSEVVDTTNTDEIGADSSTSHDKGREINSAVAMSTQIAGAKNQLVIKLMRRPNGASIADLTAATGWLPHTTRAALSGLRKKGIAIERHPVEDGGASVYRIATGTSRQAA